MNRLTRAGVTLFVVSHATLLVGGCAHSTPPTRTGSLAERQPLATRSQNGEPPPVSQARNPGTDDNSYDSEGALDDDQAEDSSTAEYRGSNARPHPLASYTDDELADLFAKHPSFVGSISMGKPNAGRLINGVRPKESTLYHLVDPAHAWGTSETVEAVGHVLEVVARLHPGTQIVDIGHISAAEGGPLKPHHSHQSGRDVDLGLYYSQPGMRWYTRATERTLDVPRTWTLIRTLASDTDIEMILLDRQLQGDIERYAHTVESDGSWVHRLFHGDGKLAALVRHCPGHATHMHLCFYNPVARETARRLGPFLPVEHHRETRDVVTTTVHVASSGDTLARLAQRFHTTMDAIRKANRMHTFQLVAGQRYIIPLELTPPSNAARQPNTAHKR